MDEVSTARIALSCHFALDNLCDKEGGASRFDSLSSDSMSRDLKELWPNGQPISPKVGRRLRTALRESRQ